VTNTLAYDGRKLTTVVKSFIGFPADSKCHPVTQANIETKTNLIQAIISCQ